MNINDGPSIERVWGSGRVFSDARFKLDGKPTARAVHSNASNACKIWVHSQFTSSLMDFTLSKQRYY